MNSPPIASISNLIYDPNVDISLIKNVLFVHNSVYQLKKDSNEQTFVIVYDYSSSSDEAMKLLKSIFSSKPSFERIGFAFHYTGSFSRFMNREMLFNNSDLQENVAFSKNTRFILDLIQRFRVPHVDFFACNTLLDNNWKKFYQILQTQTGVIVGASDNKTGNIKYGGDWVMESTKEDVSQVYFSSAIINFASVLDTYTDPADVGAVYEYNTELLLAGTAKLLSYTESEPAVNTSYTVLSSFVVDSVTYTVTLIGDHAFSTTRSLTSVVIPDSVTSIEDWAFSTSLITNITIPNSVTNMGVGVFWECTALTSITIPSSVTIMGYGTFLGCSSLTSVTISNGITSIPDFLCYICAALTSVTIPNSVTSISATAFWGCIGGLVVSIDLSGKSILFPTLTDQININNIGTDLYRVYASDGTTVLQDNLAPSTPYTYDGVTIVISSPPEPTGPIVCFKTDAKILTNKGYVQIQDLRKGDLIKTLKNDYKPIDMIGKREIYHPASLQERIKDQLYKCSQMNYPELFEDLVITGCHSILVDRFVDQEQKEDTIQVNGDTYVTDGKYRLPACVDKRSSVYETQGTYTIYHFALENEDSYMNYGVYANGLLVETCSQIVLENFANMTLIE